ncbi:hypothetical protein SKAU_G00364390 [Synaphobranchus kaupii]|uniref:SUMO-interacting motif-containing protein 1 n=1 Tax=Synaphobranchus kaupii TaxID=118154 RepID=A0A9Q1EET1_SYNKA|nr:hypothetical protein SKAU_G00364390 [Synaphobranchus kaupii]
MDVIYISSGSEEDSDIEIVSVYKNTKDKSKEFARQWPSFTPPYIDLTDSSWEPLQRRNRRRGNGSPLVVRGLSENSQSEGEAEPLSSGLELATPVRERKTLCHSPTISRGKGDRVPDFLGNLISETLECSVRQPSLELREEQKPQDYLDSKSWSFPLKSHCQSASENLLAKDEIPGSPLSTISEPAWISQIHKSEQKTPGCPKPQIVTPNLSDEMPVSSVASSWLEYKMDDAVQDAEAKVRPLSAEGSLGETEKDFPNYSNVTSPQSPFSTYFCPSEIDLMLHSNTTQNGSPWGVEGLSDNGQSEGKVEPPGSSLELATAVGERKTLCHSPTISRGKGDRVPDFLDNLISETWECSVRQPSLELREEQKPWDYLDSKSWSCPLKSEAKVRPLSAEGSLGETEKEKSKEPGDLGAGFPDYPHVTSPHSSFSSYYCPSEIDLTFYSNSNSTHESLDGVSVCSPALPPTPPTPSYYPIGDHLQEDLVCRASPNNGLPRAEVLSDRQLSSPPPPSPGAYLQFSESEQSPPLLLSPRSVSPTSTEILASDSSDWQEDDAELTDDCPPSLLGSVSPSRLPASGEMELDAPWSNPGAGSTAVSEGEELSGTEAESGAREASRKDQQYVSRTQLNRLKRLMGRPLQDLGGDDRPESVDDDVGEEDEEEDPGPVEPVCRQGLSLVQSAMEEHCHESTLQLLSDFLHPRLYPPPDVVSHLIRGILLDPESSPALVLQAYSLLMRIQKNHPATVSTVQWDWDLLASVMDERTPEQRLPTAVLCLLLQYVLQTLDDDFHLGLRRLPGSIAKATISCNRHMAGVRDVINWLVAAVMSSTGDPGEPACEAEETEEKQKERDENLKMVLTLQKMLALAVEVDCYPTTSSNKISEDLLQILICTVPHRCHRLLFLQTLESRLLQCKLVELLLQHVCADKTELPMSLSLILHFLHSAALSPDPTDGAESWRRWRELVQLLWILALSYEEVTEGHLRRPVFQRAKFSRAPVWTTNDDITRATVQEAAESFLSRASADVGHALPPQVQELLSCLQDHLFSFCQH